MRLTIPPSGCSASRRSPAFAVAFRTYGKPLIWLVLLLSPQFVQAAVQPSQVVILVNKDQPISARVAAMYEKLREIPPENVLKLALGGDRNITPDAYWQKVGGPVKQYLDTHPAIRCIVTTSGVPYTIQPPNGEGIAFDNELAAVLLNDPSERRHSLPNPLYMGGENRYGIVDPRLLRMVYVGRLDGPDLATITRMVEDAVAVEKTGLTGPVYGDAQGLDGITGYGIGDFSIRAAMDRLSGAGFKAVLDMKQESWKQPKGGVGNQAAGAAFYTGWYDLLNFQDIFGEHGLARGAIAWHIASQEAQNIWDPGGGWCLGLMRRGAAVTLGPVREPYIAAFPHGDIFLESLLTGGSVVESYWLALPHVSWAMVILGDPLYRPFQTGRQPSLIARAYVADNPQRILQKNETAPLLVEIECVGPPGSSTPVTITKAVPEMGLAAASGSVTIPGLKAGELTIVRVPSVTAGDDATGMFRLRLETPDNDPAPRRIVLEGRTGFSRLTGGLAAKTQMFVSPDGGSVISGLPGRTETITTANLYVERVDPPHGYALTGAAYSPNGGRLAINIYEPEQKIEGVVITDSHLRGREFLPRGAQFIRWLDAEHVLMMADGHLASHNVVSLEDHIFEIPAGQSGSVIPGTDTVLMTTADGKFGYKTGAGEFHEVLAGVKLGGSIAAANDLSLFGGVDKEKRLWCQFGPGEPPTAVMSGVERALWGPISRRVLVQGADKKSRVYDARDRSWIDLGNVSVAVWSPDEERLLFVESVGPSESYLSLLSGHKIQRLCNLGRIGSITRMELSRGKNWAFLLAGLSSQANVWIMALPPV